MSAKPSLSTGPADAGLEAPRRADGVAETVSLNHGVFRTLVEAAPLAIAVHVDGVVVYANRCAEDVLGVPPGAARGLAVLDLVHPDFAAVVGHRMRALSAGRSLPGSVELTLVRPDGQSVRIESVASQIDVDGRPGVAVLACDVTERARREAHYTYLATHDGLTGLPNRLLLIDRLDQALARVGRGCAGVLVLFMDLDGFKQVNDAHGHAAGDILLREVAGRLRSAVRVSDTVARLAGDEFVIAAELDSLDLAAPLQGRLTDALADPYTVEGVQLRVGASIGALVLDQPRTAHEVLVEADRRMYAVKHER